MSNYLVLDIGGTYIKYALMTEEKILEQGQIETIKESFDAFIEQLNLLFSRYSSKFEGLAISMPGVINPQEGFAFHGGALWFIKDTPLKYILEKEFNTRVSIENDGKSSAMGELWKGKLVNAKNGVVIVLGTGIGGGIIANGELLRGEYFSAGEFSSLRTDGLNLYSIDKTLGEKASVINLTRAAALIANHNPETFTGNDLFKLLERGNIKIKKIFDEYCDFIVGQILNLQMILDPEVFVISGGLSKNPILIDTLNKSLNKLYSKDDLSKRAGKNTVLVNSELGNDANLWGALYHHLEQNKNYR